MCSAFYQSLIGSMQLMGSLEPEASTINDSGFVTDTLPIDNHSMTTHINSQALVVEGTSAVNAARPFGQSEIARADEAVLSKYKHPPSTPRSHFMTGGGSQKRKTTTTSRKSAPKKRAAKPKSKSTQSKRKQQQQKKKASKGAAKSKKTSKSKNKGKKPAKSKKTSSSKSKNKGKKK